MIFFLSYSIANTSYFVIHWLLHVWKHKTCPEGLPVLVNIKKVTALPLALEIPSKNVSTVHSLHSLSFFWEYHKISVQVWTPPYSKSSPRTSRVQACRVAALPRICGSRVRVATPWGWSGTRACWNTAVATARARTSAGSGAAARLTASTSTRHASSCACGTKRANGATVYGSLIIYRIWVLR